MVSPPKIECQPEFLFVQFLQFYNKKEVGSVETHYMCVSLSCWMIKRATSRTANTSRGKELLRWSLDND